MRGVRDFRPRDAQPTGVETKYDPAVRLALRARTSSLAPLLMKVHVLIPALNPCDRLIGVVGELLRCEAVASIIVVNDGSDADCDPVFQAVAARPRVELLRHQENRGKGAALRTGIRRFLDREAADDILITADADGQHLPSDILAVAAMAQQQPASLVLGTRTLRGDVPLRSRFGNELTRFIFRLFTRERLTDTQTGLRAVPRTLLQRLLAARADRYAFELEMLLLASRLGIPFVTVPIQTVYLEGNADSHFRPIADSARIYWVFARYLLR